MPGPCPCWCRPDLNRLIVLSSLLFIFIHTDAGSAQDAGTIVTDTTRSTGISDTVSHNLWPYLWRSALVPGWGQIEQDNPGRGVVFYGLSVNFAVHLIESYNRYRDTRSSDDRVSYYRNLFWFLTVYTINIIDVVDTELSGRHVPWQGELLSDTPLKYPWGAVARSAMLPGWGQLYNEQYIKAGIALGTFSFLAGRVIRNARKFNETGESPYKEKRVANSWLLGLTYVLILADAYVDAHLYRFDDAMELAAWIGPDRMMMRLTIGF